MEKTEYKEPIEKQYIVPSGNKVMVRVFRANISQEESERRIKEAIRKLYRRTI